MKFVISILFFLISEICISQKDSTYISDEIIFDTPEIQAEFPGGIQKMYEYLSKNLQLPTNFKTDNYYGRCYLRFTIDEVGGVDDIVILKSVSKEIDSICYQAVCFMPNWTPAKMGNKPVKSSFTIPIQIHFR
jgi:periplasmic protein TonB